MIYYLVTGGSGFIGSNFIENVMKYSKEAFVINYDLLTYAGDEKNNEGIDKTRYRFIHGDVTDKDKVKAIFMEYPINYVVNFAAETHVDNSIEGPGVFVQSNVVGTQNMLEIARRAWEIGKDKLGYPVYKTGVKFLQVSTDEVYGSLDEEGLFSESSKIAPNSPYSASKASADLIVKAYFETFHLPINITRCSNNYGPKQFPEKLIPLFIKKALNNEKLPVYGDGMQVRDWLHVDDHCKAIFTVIEKGKLGEVYNVGGMNERANLEIIHLILKQLDKSSSLISHVEDRLGHDRRYAIDNTKITKELNWRPDIKFEEGIVSTIDWYIKFFN